MFPKISLTAAFILMVAPPMACASRGAQRNLAQASVCGPAHRVVVAQANQRNDIDNDADTENDNDSNDNSDDNQNADNNQMENQNAGNGSQVQPQNFDAPEAQTGEAIRVPPLTGYPGQINPNE
jgi:hypothetical protein